MAGKRVKLKLAYEEMERINKILQEEILERKKIEKEVLEISEKEQRRLGAQIHDDLCQQLTGIMILTKVLAQRLARKNFAESFELKHIVELLDQSITQAREMARGFYLVELQSDSLMMALKDLANRTQNLYGVECHFVCPEQISIEDNKAATHLYRIVQEAVLNAVNHGKAKHVEIALRQQDSQMILNVFSHPIRSEAVARV